MESAFTGVLLESALKLSNVTDANIFILVETSEGRQWAGNRRLKVGNVNCARDFVEVVNVCDTVNVCDSVFAHIRC